MPYVNFTLQDIFGIVIAFLLFPLFLFIPGYFIGWISNSLNFRHRSLPLKVLLSLVLSVSVWPIATFLVARFLSMQAVWILHIFVWIAFVYLCIQSVISTKSNSNKARFRLNRYLMIGLALVIVWCVIAILSLIDLQIGNKLYFSVMSYDYGLRTSITNAITRTGIPPTNPSFYPGHPLGVSYYYFWFLLCSLVEQMTGSWIEARYAVMGGTLWIGIILMATIAVYLRFQTAQGAKNIQIRSIIGALLLFVTGLDILPVAALNINRLRAHLPLLFDMEAWDTQVTAWIGALLWVPNHIAGLVACIVALIIFNSTQNDDHPRKLIVPMLVAACSLASAIGLSVWVTFIFALFWGVWVVVLFLSKQRRKALFAIITGIVAIVVSMPYLIDTITFGMSRQQAPITLTIRPFIEQIYYVPNPVIASSIDAILLPGTYFVEFGFFLAAGFIYYRAHRKSQENYVAIALLATSVIASTFLKSSIFSNDLGWRGIMLAQFVLLIWSVDIIILIFRRFFARFEIESLTRRWLAKPLRALLIVLLLGGIVSTIYDLLDLRFAPIVADADVVAMPPNLSADHRLGERTLAMRQTYMYIQQNYPQTIITQHNPEVGDLYIERYHLLYGYRQVIVSDQPHGMVYGVSQQIFKEVNDKIAPLFSSDTSLQKVDEVCSQYSIDLLVAKDTDPIWADSNSWMWKRQPIFHTDFSRVIPCGKAGAPYLKSF